MINFPTTNREPTRKELANFRNWVKYLKDSKLSESEVYKRAASFASQGRKPND